MNKKKLQIFISSTYTDLKEERQVAVEAILKAGHIPAGMELFSAGNKSQLEVVKQWIDDSDIYMLILGGRYGSIESESNKSYTEIEYRYAMDKGMPLFAIVISDKCLDKKLGTNCNCIEKDCKEKYNEFKALVTSKLCKFFDDSKDITIAILQTIHELEKTHNPPGWISGRDIEELKTLSAEKNMLVEQNTKLNKQIQELNGALKTIQTTQSIGEFNGGLTYGEVKKILSKAQITFPKDEAKYGEWSGYTGKLIDLFCSLSVYLNRGVCNAHNVDGMEAFVFYRIGTELLKYDLVEYQNVPNDVRWTRLRTSDRGFSFLAKLEQEKILQN